MRAKTVKRLAILSAVVVMTGGSACAVWKFQVGKMAQGVVQQADKAVEKGNYAEAAELYQQHLLVVPGDLAVQLKYADAQEAATLILAIFKPQDQQQQQNSNLPPQLQFLRAIRGGGGFGGGGFGGGFGGGGGRFGDRDRGDRFGDRGDRPPRRPREDAEGESQGTGTEE